MYNAAAMRVITIPTVVMMDLMDMLFHMFVCERSEIEELKVREVLLVFKVQSVIDDILSKVSSIDADESAHC